jgi:hypothetical protein
LKADSAKFGISVVKPDRLRVTYAGWDDHICGAGTAAGPSWCDTCRT